MSLAIRSVSLWRWPFRNKAFLTPSRRSETSWAAGVADEHNNVQSYISTINDPFLNLSIEHYLLERSPAQSTILFLYVNRPCIVIGRNQNPWFEVNLAAMSDTSTSLGHVELVRRRSGGGAVFHDFGNVNWTVIMPADNFTRDKHAEMVVRALRSHGVDRARVNERHDIVLDQGQTRQELNAHDLHRSPYTMDDGSVKALKVSGSAYKVIKGRALHHGTCLLESPNLLCISHLLQSPARRFIRAKGVESVSSPITNIGLATAQFQEAIQTEFTHMYGTPHAGVIPVGSETIQISDIALGREVMHTPEWIWDQTPSFTLSYPGNKEIQAPAVSADLHPTFRVSMEFRHAQCTSAAVSISPDPFRAAAEAKRSSAVMQDRRLREKWTWRDAISAMRFQIESRTEDRITQWFQAMLPKPRD